MSFRNDLSGWRGCLLGVCTSLLVACSGDAGDPSGSSGGTSGSGGNAGTSGSTGTGGSAGASGSTSTGGSGGASGSTSTGGSAGASGSTSTGGSSGAAGAGAAGSVVWNPGFYIVSQPDADSKARVMSSSALNDFDGAEFRYQWTDMEGAPGVFDFATLDADLRALAARSKKLLVFLDYKAARGEDAVPADLRTGALGDAQCSADGSACGQFAVDDVDGDAFHDVRVPLMWNATVSGRMQAWIAAVAAHLDHSSDAGAVAGIVFPETAISDWDLPLLLASDYTPEGYLAGLQANLVAATTGGPRFVVLQYINGGFHPAVPTGPGVVAFKDQLAYFTLSHPHSGIGAPDLAPAAVYASATDDDGPMFDTSLQGHVAIAPSIQSPDYGGLRTTGVEQTMACALQPAPVGTRASFVAFAFKAGSDAVFDLDDAARWIREHPTAMDRSQPSWQ